MRNTFYTVAITALSGPVNSDGFIDNKKIENYMAGGSTPTTAAQSITKERGNSRYETMISTLGMLANLYVHNPVATDGLANATPSAFSFTLESEHGDSVLVTPDESNGGALLTGALALKRVIARSLLVSKQDFSDYYDPTLNNAITANGTMEAGARIGVRIEKVDVGKLANTISEAEAAITVTKITSL